MFDLRSYRLGRYSDVINNDGYVIAPLADTITSTLRRRTHTLQRPSTIHKDRLYHQRGVGGTLTFILLLPVLYGRPQQLMQRSGRMLRMMLQQRQGLLNLHSTDLISQ